MIWNFIVNLPRTNVTNSRYGHSTKSLTSMLHCLGSEVIFLGRELFALAVNLFALAVKLFAMAGKLLCITDTISTAWKSIVHSKIPYKDA